MLKAYRIRFFSPSTPVRSYTLFGAVAWAYRLLGNDLRELLERFKEDPPFLLTSTFPLAEINGRSVPLLPKPILSFSSEFFREDDICKKVKRKPVKKARFITPKALKDIIKNGSLEEKEFFTEGFKGVDGTILSSDEYENLRQKAGSNGISFRKTEHTFLSVRNVLNRRTMRSENLFTERAYLYGDRYFLIYLRERVYDEILKNCFELIGDIGLGANKNLGWGKVSIKEDDSILEGLEPVRERLGIGADSFITLSCLLPSRRKVKISESSYSIETYKSPIETSFGYPFIWKRKVLYLIEGSVIASKGEGFAGCIKKVGGTLGDQTIEAYQYGYEFPLSLEEKDGSG